MFFHRFRVNHSTIFINGGAGALSIAVITISLSMNYKFFIYVSNPQKKCFLLQSFPSLTEENISYSDPELFYRLVAEKTDGKMCNIVLNCSSGSESESAIKFGGPGSVILELNTCDINPHNNFGMSYLKTDRSFKILNVSNIFKPENLRMRQNLHSLLAEGIAKGTVKPLPHIILPPDQVVNGMKILSRRQNRGRIVINMNSATNNQNLKLVPRVLFNSQCTHIVVCDNLEVTIGILEWLITRGSRKFLLYGYSNLKSRIFLFKQRYWERVGVIVKVFEAFSRTVDDCSNAINSAIELGPIEGIFIFNSIKGNRLEKKSKEDLINESVLTICNFDVLSRKICKDLRFFVVICNNTGHLENENIFLVTEKICQDRKDDGYPAIAYKTRIQTDLSSNNDSLSFVGINVALVGLEMGIQSDWTKILAYNNNKSNEHPKSLFFSKVALILGVKCLERINENKTLSDLVNNLNILEEIGSIIKNVYQLTYTIQELEMMSIRRLKGLQNAKNVKNKFNDGIGAFISTIEDEFNVASNDYFTIMPTPLSNNVENHLMFEPDNKYMLLLPGLDGNHRVFESFCKRLKIRAITIEYETITTNESFQQMAVNILKNLKRRINIRSKFYILGYSFGINIAVELVTLLEKEGYDGVLFALDSSPDVFKDQFDSYVGHVTLGELQNIILDKVYSILKNTEENLFLKNIFLKQFNNWEDKIEFFIQSIKHEIKYSHDYLKQLLETLYKRVVLLRDYKPHLVLSSRIVLIKGLIHPNSKGVENDYSLSKYSKHPVEIFDIESDHVMAPYDLRISDIINSRLDPDEINNFNDCNICETYLS